MSSDTSKWATSVGAAGGGGLVWATDKWHWQWPDALITAVFVASLLCLVAALFLWVRDGRRWWANRHRKAARSDRMPLLELRDEATKQGWKFTNGHSLHPLDFIHGLRQAGKDGVIKFWGRPDRNASESLTRKELLQEIPPDHFVNFDINVDSLTPILVGGDAPTDNFHVKTYSMRVQEKGFADLHVAKAQALRWLRRSADQFKGTHKPRQ